MSRTVTAKCHRFLFVFSYSYRSWKSEIRVPTCSVLVRALFLTYTWQDRKWALASFPLIIRTLIPQWGPYPHDDPRSSKPNYLPKTPSPNTITLRIRLQHKNSKWGLKMNIQSTEQCFIYFLQFYLLNSLNCYGCIKCLILDIFIIFFKSREQLA